jgi:hypothetical protein
VLEHELVIHHIVIINAGTCTFIAGWPSSLDGTQAVCQAAVGV